MPVIFFNTIVLQILSPSFVVMTHVGDGPFLAKKNKEINLWLCDNPYFSPEELSNDTQHPIKHMSL